jgi:hypothetical protein
MNHLDKKLATSNTAYSIPGNITLAPTTRKVEPIDAQGADRVDSSTPYQTSRLRVHARLCRIAIDPTARLFAVHESAAITVLATIPALESFSPSSALLVRYRAVSRIGGRKQDNVAARQSLSGPSKKRYPEGSRSVPVFHCPRPFS